jgi:hypothetical protein
MIPKPAKIEMLFIGSQELRREKETKCQCPIFRNTHKPSSLDFKKDKLLKKKKCFQQKFSMKKMFAISSMV